MTAAFQKETHTFTKNDRWGQPHTYEVTLHGALEGTRIMMALVGLAGPALAGMAAQTFGSDTSLGEVKLATIDWAAVGVEVQKALMDESTNNRVRQILRNTIRDGMPLEQGYDAAYRGNYQEALVALWEVVRINGFFPLLDMLSSSDTGIQ